MSQQNIRQSINDIISELKTNNKLKTQLDKELYIMNKYPTLYDSHPFLLKKITKIYNDKEQLQMLYLMLDKIDQINNGDTTQAEVELDLGQKLADKYLK